MGVMMVIVVVVMIVSVAPGRHGDLLSSVE